ncbi:protein split ends-like [Littorina saxatilis]|uniref:Coiled-coil domain-containing protein n=1 Tax=Littorina saxatilis TaxID=31220 RepID=A0AAN9BZX6_9CAEN
METFTLFVVLPNEDICSLRNLPSGTSIRAVRKKLELSAGLPAQTYRLSCTKGQVLHEDHVLRVDLNVWDGFLLRAVFLDSWRELYDKVVEDDIVHVIQHGAVHMRKDVVWIDGEDEAGRAKEVMRERGVVALFLASFLGMRDMCKALLSVEVDPNGRTPFGRTPLFVTMTRDNDHVMELLLAHNARLESRDVEGVTALDLARRVGAKECLRKIRHMKLQSVGEASPPGSRASSQGSPERRRRLGPRVVRIPSGTVLERQSSVSSIFSDKPATKLTLRENRNGSPVHSTGSDKPATKLTLRENRNGSPVHSTGSETFEEGKSVSASYPVAPKTSSLPPPRILFREGDRYSWDNNLTHLSRTHTAAGTYVRAPPPSSSLSHRPQSTRPGTRAGRRPNVSWSDTLSVSSGNTTARMLPFRPSVHNLSTKGPGSVLSTSSTSISHPTTTTVTMHSVDARNGTPSKGRRPGSALIKFCVNLPPPPPLHSSRENSPPRSQAEETQEAHGPAQEPPGRPPTRLDCKLPASSGFDADSRYHHHAGSVGNSSVMGSQEALSVGSAPEFVTGSGADTDRSLGAGLQAVDHGESDDNGGRVLSSRGNSSRTSARFRARLLVSRQKEQESWRTMKRRINLAEEQKKSNKNKAKQKEKTQKENFDKWLEKKRNERQRSQPSSEEDTSEDDDDVMNRSAENSQAFTDWLKDLKERPKRRPHTSSPASLHRRKTRPLKDLIQIDGNIEPVPAPETDSYVTAYQQWQHSKNTRQQGQHTRPGARQQGQNARPDTRQQVQNARADTRQQGAVVDIKEAKLQLEEKRKSMLAAALTYEDWLEHAEERKKLMQTILRADMEQLESLEQQLSRSRRAPRQISFDQWRGKVEKKETEIRQHRQRMRQEAEQQEASFFRSSAAIAHEEWVRRKKEDTVKNKSKGKISEGGDGKGGAAASVSEDEKRAAWEAWLEQKHRHEVAQLDQHLRKERQLVLALRQKKTHTVTQC